MKSPFSFLNENQRAIVYLVLAGMGFGVSDTLTKLSSFSIPISEVVFIRGLATSFLFLVALRLTGGLVKIFMAARPVVLARGGFEMLATITFIAALPHVRMADLTTLAMSSPIVLIIIAMVFYGERVGWHRWAAIAGGVLGVILIVKPDPTGFNAWALLGAACALFSAARDVVTRQVDPAAPSLAVALVGSILITMFGLVSSWESKWPVPTTGQVGYLVVAGICHGLGIYMTVLSFRGKVLVSLVSPFRYVSLLWAVLGGFLAFREIPDVWTFAGATLIVSSGLYALHREVVRKRYWSVRASSEH